MEGREEGGEAGSRYSAEKVPGGDKDNGCELSLLGNHPDGLVC